MSKKLSRKAIRKAAKVLRNCRLEADESIASRCNVVGSMIGAKVRGGEVLPGLSLTFLVREKIPLGDLSERERIPPRLTIGGVTIATDVVAWPRMVLQNLQTGRYLRDGYTQGTLTAFAQSPDGLWGLSCGHCLLGTDQQPYTSAEIQMVDSMSGSFVPAGSTGLTLFSPGGPIIANSRGFLDCGLFTLEDGSLMVRAESAPQLGTVDPVDLLHQRLNGDSLMQVGNAPPGPRSATVIGVDQYGVDDFSDLVLQVDPPGTIFGDSGLLWRTADGLAAAIHSRGEVAAAGEFGSFLTAAMSAKRAAYVLNVSLRQA